MDDDDDDCEFDEKDTDDDGDDDLPGVNGDGCKVDVDNGVIDLAGSFADGFLGNNPTNGTEVTSGKGKRKRAASVKPMAKTVKRPTELFAANLSAMKPPTNTEKKPAVVIITGPTSALSAKFRPSTSWA